MIEDELGTSRNGKPIFSGSLVEHLFMGRGVVRGRSPTGGLNWQDFMGLGRDCPANLLKVIANEEED